MKRRIFMMAVLSLVFVTSGFAQFQRSIFNHVGLNVGAGTEGINVGVAAPLTNYLELEAGVSLMPSIKANADVDLHSNASLNVQGSGGENPGCYGEYRGGYRSYYLQRQGTSLSFWRKQQVLPYRWFLIRQS